MTFIKTLIKNLYEYYFREDMLQNKEIIPNLTAVSIPNTVSVPLKTNSEKLYDIAYSELGIDPTPLDEQPDDYACVQSLTTILKKLVIDFPVLTYTPILLEHLKNDNRFKEVTEMRKGIIIISPTNTGNGNIVGHTGICGENGKIMSNSSATGLWSDKFDQVSWITRYSKGGQLDLHLFELL